MTHPDSETALEEATIDLFRASSARHFRSAWHFSSVDEEIIQALAQ